MGNWIDSSDAQERGPGWRQRFSLGTWMAIVATQWMGSPRESVRSGKRRRPSADPWGPSTLKSLLRKMRLKSWDQLVGRKPGESGTFKAKGVSKDSGCHHQSQRLQDVQQDKG